MQQWIDTQMSIISMIDTYEKGGVPSDYWEMKDGGNVMETGNIDIEDVKKHLNLVKQARVYEIDGRVYRTFMLTPNKPRKVNLPFPVLFLNPHIEFNKTIINGLLIEYDDRYGDGDWLIRIITKKITKPLPKGMTVSEVIRKSDPHEKYLISRYNIWLNKKRPEIEKRFNKEHGGDLTSLIRRTIMNFNDFLEHPEIIIKEKVRTNNEKRVRRGKKALPDSTMIKVTGELRIYINSIESTSDEDNNMGKCFEVAGHWRTYRHPRYTSMQGDRQFIHPYIKGTGVVDTRRRKIEHSKTPKNNLLSAKDSRKNKKKRKKMRN